MRSLLIYMKIIFDLDHTLYSTKKLYNTFVEAFKELGLNEKLFHKTFEEAKRGEDLYNKERHFNLIVEYEPSISHESLEQKWREVLDGSIGFLYPDVFPVLERLKEKYSLYILSYGMENVQKDKIEGSNIKGLFKEIYITRDIGKTSILEKILKEKEKAVFIDDNIEVLSKVRRNFPDVVVVRINRGEGRYKEYPDNSEFDFSIKNLEELERIILTEI